MERVGTTQQSEAASVCALPRSFGCCCAALLAACLSRSSVTLRNSIRCVAILAADCSSSLCCRSDALGWAQNLQESASARPAWGVVWAVMLDADDDADAALSMLHRSVFLQTTSRSCSSAPLAIAAELPS